MRWRSRNLVVSYGAKRAVDGIDLAVRQGEIFGLLGPNGAGKTSTLSAVEGLLRPDAGSIVIGGIDIRTEPAAAKASLGVQLQATSFQAELTISADRQPVCPPLWGGAHQRRDSPATRRHRPGW